ncbi:hypothetical protein FQN57_002642 [Myotisia sp. PD_48]|nr:hypothetical protein FQN57_002642 [Myotisia sp. PD_48]
MAFSTPFGGWQQPATGMGGGNGKIQTGPELQEIETQDVGFLAIGGDAKVRLLPTAWPADSIPTPTASLLSVASNKGILAAAGPQGLVVARTESVRKTFIAPAAGDSNIRPFQPELQIPLSAKISHLAFSADENILVVAVEGADGLVAYDVAALLGGTTQPAATLNINGSSLRFLLPNPVTPELFAAVTTTGELLIANLKLNQLVSGSDGTPVLKSGVSSVCWSNKGKQLVAGLGDGSIFQLTPSGQSKAEIPKAPEVGADYHVSSIFWLGDNLFFVVYTPNSATPENSPPVSFYYIITRTPPDQYQFNKLPEVCAPFGLERFPAYQYVARLRKYPPDLQDVLVVSSTASTDIGLFTKSGKGLAQATTAVFTSATMSEDSRRATLPMTEDMNDTSPVGMALDLSSTDVVPSPIQGDETKDSANPLPAILVLTNDGVLSGWWFVYTDAIKNKAPYPGLAVVKDSQQPQPAVPATAPQATNPPSGQSAFGQSGFGAFNLGTGSPLANRSTFGAPSTPGGMGTTTVGFGSPSTMGNRGAGVAFGSSGFGQPSIFGAGNLSAPTGLSGFAGLGGTDGGFGSFASGAATASASASPFGGIQSTGTSPFATAGQPSGASPFGGTTPGNQNPFKNAGQAFGSFGATTEQAKPTFGFGQATDSFKLEPTFKPDSTVTMDEDKPEQPNGVQSSLSFGTEFGGMLAQKAETNNIEKPSEVVRPVSPEQKSLFKDQEKFATPKFKGLFGSQSNAPVTPESTTPTTSFTMPPAPTEPESTTPAAPPLLHSKSSSLSDSIVKVEKPSDIEETPSRQVPEPPLPPESTSKVTYAPGDTSASSSGASGVEPDEAPAPLPPDFLTPTETKEKPEEAAAVTLPEESVEKAESEGSGEDIGLESSSEEKDESQLESFKISPESSFGAGVDKNTAGGLFSKIVPAERKAGEPKQLFGEIAHPVLLPPKRSDSRVRLSPRSPSPVRRHGTKNIARADVRSTSAPSAPDRALGRRKATLESSMLSRQLSPPPDDEFEEAKALRASQAQKLAAEFQTLEEDDEDEQLRADLARPISPSPTLDPYLLHEDYSGETDKPGIPGQIELLYRDINTMIDTLGINARSLSSFLLYQESTKENDYKRWLRILQSDRCSDVLNERLLLSEMGKLQQGVDILDESLRKGRVEGVQEKFDRCQQLITKELSTLRGQCSSIRKTLDAHTDAMSVASAPLSAEQSALQQDLRKFATEARSKLADLEKEISIFRARLADSNIDGSGRSGRNVARPTVEAVTSTIATMTNMAEKKSGDVDLLEAQLKRLGLDIPGSPAATPSGRDASPFRTPPAKKSMVGRLPTTPGSRSSQDGGGGGGRSLYQTPESSHPFRTSLLARDSRSPGPDNVEILVGTEDLQKWRAKTARRREIVGHLKTALINRKIKVRPLDEG